MEFKTTEIPVDMLHKGKALSRHLHVCSVSMGCFSSIFTKIVSFFLTDPCKNGRKTSLSS